MTRIRRINLLWKELWNSLSASEQVRLRQVPNIYFEVVTQRQIVVQTKIQQEKEEAEEIKRYEEAAARRRKQQEKQKSGRR
jgi:hypothetical protein